MPEVKALTSHRLRLYVDEFGKDVFFTDGTILFCRICEVKVLPQKKITILQHISLDKHVQGLQRQVEIYQKVPP
jgi:hypothetical protein